MIRIHLYTDPHERREPDATVEAPAYEIARMHSRALVNHATKGLKHALDGHRPYLVTLDDGRGNTLTYRWEPRTPPTAVETTDAIVRELRSAVDNLVREWRSYP